MLNYIHLQTNSEKEILSNQFGSERYARFVQSLGNLFRLRDCNPQRVYLGGLETNGNDGEFTYGWHDESTQCEACYKLLCIQDTVNLYLFLRN